MYAELKFSTSACALKVLLLEGSVVVSVTDFSTSALVLALFETSALPGVCVNPRVKP